MYLLDTNVVSDIRRRMEKPVAWIGTINPDLVYLSVITLGEIEHGIVKKRRESLARAAELEQWLNQLRQDSGGHILPITEEIALAWGRLPRSRDRREADALIAATALVHDLIVVTRNTADFEDTGVRLLNPWTV